LLQVILVVAVCKVAYGAFLEKISFCDCFVNYEGAYKNRVESVGAVILNGACFMGTLFTLQGCFVITFSPLKGPMVLAIVQTLLTGVVTGFIAVWFTFHFLRIGELGIQRTHGNCVKQMDTDGDGK
jgi:hypothetical protein